MKWSALMGSQWIIIISLITTSYLFLKLKICNYILRFLSAPQYGRGSMELLNLSKCQIK